MLFLSKNIWRIHKNYLYLYTQKFKLVNIMKERILKILENENISAAKFADILGVQRSSISHIISGRNKPSLDFVQKILSKFPQINSDWLLFGKGNFYRNNSAPTSQKTSEPTVKKNETSKLNFEQSQSQPTIQQVPEQQPQNQRETQQPVYQDRQQQQPVYQQPIQQQPVYQQPIQQQQPMYQQPMQQQPPMYQQPMQQQPPMYQEPQQKAVPVDILQTNPDRIIVFYSNNTFAWYSPMNNTQPQPQQNTTR